MRPVAAGNGDIAPAAGSVDTAARWKVLVASFVGLAIGQNLAVALFSLFVVPLSNAFGWGRGDISLAQTILMLTLVASSPFLGMLLDRLGVRLVLLPALVLYALALGSLALLDGELMQFYLTYFFVAIFGLGAGPIVYSHLVVRWFDAKRGLALGTVLAGTGTGAIVLPPILQATIGNYGWQGGYLLLAGLLMVLTFPLAWLWAREPATGREGGSVIAAMAGRKTPATALGDVLRTRQFWQMATGFALLGVFVLGVSAHLVPLLRDKGFSAETAALMVSVLGFAIVVGRVVTGYLLDVFFAAAVVAACVAVAGAGLVMLALAGQGALPVLAVFMLGFAIGAELDFMSYLISRYFPMDAYARTYGVCYAVFSLGAAAGPLLMGYGQQTSGSYTSALYLMSALVFVSMALLGTLGPHPCRR